MQAGPAGVAAAGRKAAAPVFHAELEAASRLIEALAARLDSSHSATLVLEDWCAERGFGPEPRLYAIRAEVPDRAASAEQRDRLEVPRSEPVRYRRVRLACGMRVLSEAENWYVPNRLTPEMNALLDSTDTPFGRVVHPLAPTRRNIAMATLWQPGRGHLPEPDERLLDIRAVLSSAAVPFCEVAETYYGLVLAARSA